MFSSRIPGSGHEVRGQNTAEIEDFEKLCKTFKIHRSCDLVTLAGLDSDGPDKCSM